MVLERRLGIDHLATVDGVFEYIGLSPCSDGRMLENSLTNLPEQRRSAEEVENLVTARELSKVIKDTDKVDVSQRDLKSQGAGRGEKKLLTKPHSSSLSTRSD